MWMLTVFQWRSGRGIAVHILAVVFTQRLYTGCLFARELLSKWSVVTWFTSASMGWPSLYLELQCAPVASTAGRTLDDIHALMLVINFTCQGRVLFELARDRFPYAVFATRCRVNCFPANFHYPTSERDRKRFNLMLVTVFRAFGGILVPQNILWGVYKYRSRPIFWESWMHRISGILFESTHDIQADSYFVQQCC